MLFHKGNFPRFPLENIGQVAHLRTVPSIANHQAVSKLSTYRYLATPRGRNLLMTPIYYAVRFCISLIKARTLSGIGTASTGAVICL